MAHKVNKKNLLYWDFSFNFVDFSNMYIVDMYSHVMDKTQPIALPYFVVSI